jgi:hypothetical protein
MGHAFDAGEKRLQRWEKLLYPGLREEAEELAWRDGMYAVCFDSGYKVPKVSEVTDVSDTIGT